MGRLAAIVYIVDDDAPVRGALARLMGASGYRVSVFASAQEFLLAHDPDAEGCVILDVAMPGFGGLALQEKLNELGSRLPVIFLTGCGNISMSVQAMRAGAVTFLTKPVDAGELIAVVDEAISLNTALQHSWAAEVAARQRISSLTRRELQVLEHIVAGRLNKQIAAALGTVEQTIKVHRSRVMKKMKARSVAELVRVAACARVNRSQPSYPPN